MQAKALPTLEQLIRRHIRKRIVTALIVLIGTVAVVTVVEGLVSVSTRIDTLKTRAKALQDQVVSEIMVHNRDAIDAIIGDANASHANEHVEWHESTAMLGSQLNSLKWDIKGNWSFETPLRGLDDENYGTFRFSGNLFTDDVLVSNLTSRAVLSVFFCAVLAWLLLPVASRAPTELMLQPMRHLLALVNRGDGSVPQNDDPKFSEAKDLETEVTGLLRDRAEKEAERLELEQSRAITHAAQMLAHDIRRPFILLKEIVETMSGLPSQEQATFVEKSLPRVQNGFKNLDGMLEELLMVGRPQDASQDTVSVDSFLEQAIASTIEPDSDADRNSIVDIQSGLFVQGHEGQLQRVVSNLITNAIQAMSQGDRLSISASAEGGTVKIRVHNTGSFIPSEEQAAIFKLFYTKGKVNGSGLGLAICKRIVKNHDGSIIVQSSKESGTAFVVTLPLYSPTIDRAERAQTNVYAEIPGKRLLIADDEGFYRDSVENLASFVAGEERIQIEQVASAEEAIAVAANFDAIVIDINFAANGLDGISAVRAMRKNGIQAKIIVNSNDTSEHTQQAALRAGANAFSPKPMTAKALATVLA